MQRRCQSGILGRYICITRDSMECFKYFIRRFSIWPYDTNKKEINQKLEDLVTGEIEQQSDEDGVTITDSDDYYVEKE